MNLKSLYHSSISINTLSSFQHLVSEQEVAPGPIPSNFWPEFFLSQNLFLSTPLERYRSHHSENIFFSIFRPPEGPQKSSQNLPWIVKFQTGKMMNSARPDFLKNCNLAPEVPKNFILTSKFLKKFSFTPNFYKSCHFTPLHFRKLSFWPPYYWKKAKL